MINISDKKSGFTIVELLVSMTLFITVIAISAGSFIQILRAQRMMVSLISANNNAVLTLEEISREIRTGKNFEKNGEELKFTNARGEDVSYRLNSNEKVLEKKTGTGEFKKLTADDVLVSRFSSIIFKGDSGAQFLPRITVLISVGASGLPFETPIINLQSSISARNFE